MSLKSILLCASTVGTAALNVLIGLGPAPASAAELKLQYVDSSGGTATFDLPQSPVPFSTSSSSNSGVVSRSAAFSVSNYSGTGDLSSGTAIELTYFSEPYYFSTLTFEGFGVLDGPTIVLSTPVEFRFWTGDIDSPTFMITSTYNFTQDFFVPEPPAYITITPVPEPAAWLLMVVGFGGLGANLRSPRRRTAVMRY